MNRKRRIGAALPRSFEAELLRLLRPMILQVRATLPKISTAADAKRLGAALKREWSDKRIAGIIGGVGAKAERKSAAPWQGIVKRTDAAGDEIDGDALIRKWTTSAARLITSVRDDVARGLQRDLIAAQRSGTTAEDLAGRWIRQGVPVIRGTLEGRMRVIARHQMASLHIEVQRARATAVGVTEYVWRARPPGPNRRDEHQARDRKTFRYGDPPSDGLPGQAINCQCWAESIVPDELLGIRPHVSTIQ